MTGRRFIADVSAVQTDEPRSGRDLHRLAFMDEAGEFVYVFVGEGDTAGCPVAGFLLRVFAVDHDEAAQRRFPRRSQAEQGCGADTQASERGNGDFPTRAAHIGGGRVAQTQSRMKAALAIDGDDAVASLGRTPVAFPHLGPVRAEAQRNGAGEHGFASFAVHKRQTARGFFNQNHGFVMCAAWTPP